MIEIPWIGGAYTARSKNLNAQQCQNWYIEMDTTGAKSMVALVGVPGMKEWKDTAKTAEVRKMIVYDDNLYAIIGNTLYEYTTGKVETAIGTIGTSSGWVSMEIDTANLVIFDSTSGWTYGGAIFGEIADPDLPTPSGATYQDGYHIVGINATDQFAWCTQDTPTAWSADDFSSADGHADNLVWPVSVQRQLWLIGEDSTEIWYLTGTTPTWARNPGGYIRIGCNAKRSVATDMDQLCFLDDKNRVVMKEGFQLVPASTYQIDYLISTMSTTSDAVGFMYTQEGHTFYELSFPTDDTTICYDLSTRLWHTRASGTDDKRHRANCVVYFDDKVLVGDHANGKIYEYDLDTYQDDSTDKRCIRAAQAVGGDAEWTYFNRVEIEMDTGVGNSDDTDPQIMLQYSDDEGNTWSAEKWRSMGAIGEYGKRIGWNRLGGTRKSRIFKVIISSPVKRNITRAWVS